MQAKNETDAPEEHPHDRSMWKREKRCISMKVQQA
jgi:hypothetical protein